MFSIYLDDKPLWTPKDNDKRILKPSVNLEVNKVGSASFSVLPGHARYNDFVKMKSIITIYQDDRVLLKGRVYGNSDDFYKTKQIEIEGILGYFNDSIVRDYTFTGSPELYLKFLIDQHNKQVEPQQQFKLGVVTVKDNNDYIVRSSTETPTTWNEITNKLIENLGGYISIRYEDDGNYIDYLADYTDESSQDIAFSVNLLDLQTECKADTLATCIIPYGAKDEETGEAIDITSVNNGSDYIYDPEAVKTYGRIYEVVTWEDVTLPKNLLTKAKVYLSNKVKLTNKLTIKAVDLHLADETIESFKLGDYIRVYSEPHDIDDKVLLTSYNIDLLDPANSTITLGLEKSSYLNDNLKNDTKKTNIIRKENLNTVENVEEIKRYIQFPDGDITLGKENYNVKAIIGSDRISFLSDNKNVAYIQNQKLYVTNLEVINGVNINNNWNTITSYESSVFNSNSALKYCKIGSHVYVTGTLNTTTDYNGNASNVVCTLRNTYIPKNDISMMVSGTNVGIAKMTINSDGKINIDWIYDIVSGSYQNGELTLNINIDFWID